MPVQTSDRHLVIVCYDDSLLWDLIAVPLDCAPSVEGDLTTLHLGGTLRSIERNIECGNYVPAHESNQQVTVSLCSSFSLRRRILNTIGNTVQRFGQRPVMVLDGIRCISHTDEEHNYVRIQPFDASHTLLALRHGEYITWVEEGENLRLMDVGYLPTIDDRIDSFELIEAEILSVKL